MINYPVRIKYIDTNEVAVIEKPEDIQKNRPFIVEATPEQWGRKP